jgi:hypothetical protein
MKFRAGEKLSQMIRHTKVTVILTSIGISKKMTEVLKLKKGPGADKLQCTILIKTQNFTYMLVTFSPAAASTGRGPGRANTSTPGKERRGRLRCRIYIKKKRLQHPAWFRIPVSDSVPGSRRRKARPKYLKQ